MDNKRKSYSIDSIDNKKDVLLIIHNHGSDNDRVKMQIVLPQVDISIITN